MRFYDSLSLKTLDFEELSSCGIISSYMSLIIPTVIERTRDGTYAYDIYSRLLNDRIVFLGGPIDDHSANIIVAQLLLLDSKDKEKPVYLYINSPGGSVTAAMAILDTMNHIKAEVATVCVGLAASAGAVILSCGSPGKRSALKNAEIMIHQPHGGVEGQVSDITIAAKRLQDVKVRVNKILSKSTGKPLETITRDVERDNYMTADEAKRYGLIDKIHV